MEAKTKKDMAKLKKDIWRPSLSIRLMQAKLKYKSYGGQA